MGKLGSERNSFSLLITILNYYTGFLLSNKDLSTSEAGTNIFIRQDQIPIRNGLTDEQWLKAIKYTVFQIPRLSLRV